MSEPQDKPERAKRLVDLRDWIAAYPGPRPVVIDDLEHLLVFEDLTQDTDSEAT